MEHLLLLLPLQCETARVTHKGTSSKRPHGEREKAETVLTVSVRRHKETIQRDLKGSTANPEARMMPSLSKACCCRVDSNGF